MSNKKFGGRLAFIDFTRGLAATIMLQGHVFHSFARSDVREGGPYTISQFLGGLAPAIFLFLTGVTLGFLMDGLERKGKDGKVRVGAALRRAGYLATIAVLFRVQLWAFSWPQGQWTDLLKVDILNCMAVAVVVLAPLALYTTLERARHGLIIGLAIACAAPVISQIDPAGMPMLVRMYLVPDYRFFSFFPWAAFIAFGVSAGSIIRLVSQEQMHRVMQWAAILGFGLVMSAQYFSNLPYSLYPSVDFWLNSPGLILMKLGTILVLLAVTFLWTNTAGAAGWSWVRQLGTTSLLVYWVHIELVYGRWFGFWKEKLDNGECALFAFLLILSMIALSTASTRWNWKSIRALFSSWMTPTPERVSGD
jgi:uncharacterized membrane protein